MCFRSAPARASRSPRALHSSTARQRARPSLPAPRSGRQRLGHRKRARVYGRSSHPPGRGPPGPLLRYAPSLRSIRRAPLSPAPPSGRQGRKRPRRPAGKNYKRLKDNRPQDTAETQPSTAALTRGLARILQSGPPADFHCRYGVKALRFAPSADAALRGLDTSALPNQGGPLNGSCSLLHLPPVHSLSPVQV